MVATNGNKRTGSDMLKDSKKKINLRSFKCKEYRSGRNKNNKVVKKLSIFK
jgi:hypothetical protein